MKKAIVKAIPLSLGCRPRLLLALLLPATYPHYRCHCAATGRIGGLGTGGWVIYGPRTMPKTRQKQTVSIFTFLTLIIDVQSGWSASV